MKALFYAFLFIFITIPFGFADSLSIEINNSANKIWDDTVSETWRGKYIQLRSTRNKSSPVDELRCSEDHGSRLSIAYSYKIKMSDDVCLKLFEELKTKDLKNIKLFFKCSSQQSCELISFKDLNPPQKVSEEVKPIIDHLSNSQQLPSHFNCENY